MYPHRCRPVNHRFLTDPAGVVCGASMWMGVGVGIIDLRNLTVHAHLELLLLLGQRNGGMVVQPLRHQLQSEWVFLRRALLDLGPLVLEPNFDLGLVEVQLGAERLPTLLR